MYILCNWSFLLLLTCPCCLANDDPYPCAKLWCPSVRQVTFNRYICHLLQDPDLLPTTTTTTTTTTEEPTTAPDAPPEEDKAGVGSSGKPNIPTNHEEISVGIRFPFIGYSSPDCWTKDGKKKKPDGTRCLVTPNREQLRYGNPCYHGICKNGRCTNSIYSKCATA
uniref:Basic tail secreted protein n=1 Tax=Rhipicephalus appendiculatus TaxID=34631 RepID=A0A131Z567_RHIAP